MSAHSRIVVVGLGYIGLPTAAVLARAGCRVTGVDLDQHKVDAVNDGTLPFVEPDLDHVLRDVVAAGRLDASTEVPAADTYIVAVPTPFLEDKTADLGYVLAAARSIAPRLTGGELVILESTSPPGTTRRMAEEIVAANPALSLDGADGRPVIHVAHCPERVLPGRIMTELVENDRIIGGLTDEASQRAKELYERFCRGELLLTDAVTAELAKLTENSFRDVNIAFANELSLICDRLGVDVWRLIELANHHPRVNVLQPGPGVGGHCIAVDPWFIVSAAPEEARLIRTARQVNDGKSGYVVGRAVEAVAGTGASTVAALGLAFKANIDDLRESPARQIVRDLAGELPGCRVLAVEPHVEKLPADLAELPNVELTDAAAAVAAADVVLLLVDHDEFRGIDRSELDGKRVIDTKGLWR
ncbi:UDP-N-acetyl-D-mannosamine dehydrogenase [Jiangella rhizosphaerae]|uniref:UDP-N-acetyl-D-mannosamine dehydrogenase n=1 Tax=Jiangella rhizosphaerae TaxID=2293569 RepID=A0A418KTJ4_9ACTN|nr:UDP-N-acetyl-D-mannosamine dehydrogenase [Jiangella rhizosphaerae]RIQ28200.1 UDP-N-acetyl-D-mannosamine dehydrogenase [Jiangella rhizosphaerae]